MKFLLLLTLGLNLLGCASSTTESSPNTSEIPSSESQLQYIGLTKDLVPADFDGDPDGQPDHEFTFTHTFTDEVTLKDITLSRIESGSPDGIAGWTTTNSIQKYWILKVQLTDSNLNSNERINNIDQKLSGEVTLNLFGSDARGYALAEKGTEYELLIRFADTLNTEKFLKKQIIL